jgi:YaiO family outer membrane protein
MKIRFAWTITLALVTMTAALPAPAQETNWASQIRTLVAANEFDKAAMLVDEWIKAYPQDLDARGWHARIQAWTRHWKEAEAEYRDLLRQTPEDVDLLSGLADLLTWQKRFKEALPLLERACSIAPDRTDCRLRLARVQDNLGLFREARSSYQSVLTQDKGSREAEAALTQLRENGRHQVQVGFDADLFNYAQDAGDATLSLHSRWNRRWSTLTAISQFKRFGQDATRCDADATMHIGSRQALTIGGAVASDAGVIPKSEARIAYDQGLGISEAGPIRSAEFMVQQRWVFYEGVHLQILSPGVILYLPKNWNWLFQFSTVRSSFSTAGNAWNQGGGTRLSFPLSRRLTGHVLFSVGAENYGTVDQIHQFSAKTWGGGIRIGLAPGQELTGYAHYQNRSGGEAVTSLGMTYAFRF